MASQHAHAHVVSLVLQTLREVAGAGASLATGADTPFTDVGVDSLAATDLVSRIRAMSGLPSLAPTMALEHPTPQAMATYILEHLAADRQPDAADEDVFGFAKTSVATGRAELPPQKLEKPILLVLSWIRSGSSLLQLCLNAHEGLYAGQELYLLMFETMGERAALVGGTDYEEGLFKTVMELLKCDSERAEEFVNELGHTCTASQMYAVLQDLCGSRMLVDKTPANAGHAMILKRAPEIFAKPRYLHLVRHPYSSIESGLQLVRDILGNLNATYEELERNWLDSNMNSRDFLEGVASEHKMVMRYEDLVRRPDVELRRCCEELLRIRWEPSMANPYNTSAVDSFQARGDGKFAATDPKLLRRKNIDAKLADKWREVRSAPPVRASAVPATTWREH